MTKETEDQRIGKLLNLPHEAVAHERKRWNNSAMQTVVKARLTDRIEQLRSDLEAVTPDDLRLTQGQIRGLRLALALTAKEET